MKSILSALTPLKPIPLSLLLVDDQELVAKLVQKILLPLPGLIFHSCKHGSEALELVKTINPTLILQDLLMPDCDGLDLLVQYRSDPFSANIPVIVLSAQEDPEVKAKAFSLGANDYIVKLPDSVEFLARIRYHAESYLHLLERNEVMKKLELSQSVILQELSEAASYVESLLPQPIETPNLSVHWIYIPSTQLGGDSFGYHWLDANHFAIYLLDVCGHGVGAALLSVSVLNTLRLQSLKGANYYDPASVLKELNQFFRMEDHHDMFFTVWFGVYQSETRRLLYCSGGHPPALLVQDHAVEEFSTHDPAIGIDPHSLYQNAECIIPSNCSLYLFSDGVVELEEPSGRIRTLSDWTEFLATSEWRDLKNLETIVSEAQKVRGKSHFDDDFSLLKIDFSAASTL